MENTKWLDEVTSILTNQLNMKQDGEEYYSTIYVDYQDKYLSSSTIKEIFSEEDPRQAFFEKLDEWKLNQFPYEEDCTEKHLKEHLSESALENWEEIEMWLMEHVYYEYDPTDFDATVCVDVILDTGDFNSDLGVNQTYPHYNGDYDEPISKESSISWLANQQGYSLKDLEDALKEEVYQDSKLLKSLRSELLDASSHMNMMALLIQTDLETAFKLNEAYMKEVSLNSSYTLEERKGDGYIVLNANTTCGLYDAFMGAGGGFNVELEKELILPFRCIDSIKPDGYRGESVASIFGVTEKLWTNDGLKEIHAMTID